MVSLYNSCTKILFTIFRMQLRSPFLDLNSPVLSPEGDPPVDQVEHHDDQGHGQAGKVVHHQLAAAAAEAVGAGASRKGCGQAEIGKK